MTLGWSVGRCTRRGQPKWTPTRQTIALRPLGFWQKAPLGRARRTSQALVATPDGFRAYTRNISGWAAWMDLLVTAPSRLPRKSLLISSTAPTFAQCIG